MDHRASRRLIVGGSAASGISLSLAAETRPMIVPELAAPEFKLDAMPPNLFQRMLQRSKLVGSPGLAWSDKSTLTVAFKGGSEELYQLIKKTLTNGPTWEDNCPSHSGIRRGIIACGASRTRVQRLTSGSGLTSLDTGRLSARWPRIPARAKPP
jgi:hypothetical protein